MSLLILVEKQPGFFSWHLFPSLEPVLTFHLVEEGSLFFCHSIDFWPTIFWLIALSHLPSHCRRAGIADVPAASSWLSGSREETQVIGDSLRSLSGTQVIIRDSGHQELGSLSGTWVIIRDSDHGSYSLSHISRLCSLLLNLPFPILLYSQISSELLSLPGCSYYLILCSQPSTESHLIWEKSQDAMMDSRSRHLYIIVLSAPASLAVFFLECWRPLRAFVWLLTLMGFFWEHAVPLGKADLDHPL